MSKSLRGQAMEVMPVNSAERMYAIVVIFLGLVTRRGVVFSEEKRWWHEIGNYYLFVVNGGSDKRSELGVFMGIHILYIPYEQRGTGWSYLEFPNHLIV